MAGWTCPARRIWVRWTAPTTRYSPWLAAQETKRTTPPSTPPHPQVYHLHCTTSITPPLLHQFHYTTSNGGSIAPPLLHLLYCTTSPGSSSSGMDLRRQDRYTQACSANCSSCRFCYSCHCYVYHFLLVVSINVCYFYNYFYCCLLLFLVLIHLNLTDIFLYCCFAVYVLVYNFCFVFLGTDFRVQ